MDNSSIKANIRKVRKSRNISQEKMADYLDISLTAYKALEKGKTNIVNANVVKMAQILNTSTEEIVLGYHPVQAPGQLLEDVRCEYAGQIKTLEKRIEDLEKLIRSLEDTISTKNEVILMLKKSDDENS